MASAVGAQPSPSRCAATCAHIHGGHASVAGRSVAALTGRESDRSSVRRGTARTRRRFADIPKRVATSTDRRSGAGAHQAPPNHPIIIGPLRCPVGGESCQARCSFVSHRSSELHGAEAMGASVRQATGIRSRWTGRPPDQRLRGCRFSGRATGRRMLATPGHVSLWHRRPMTHWFAPVGNTWPLGLGRTHDRAAS